MGICQRLVRERDDTIKFELSRGHSGLLPVFLGISCKMFKVVVWAISDCLRIAMNSQPVNPATAKKGRAAVKVP